ARWAAQALTPLLPVEAVTGDVDAFGHDALDRVRRQFNCLVQHGLVLAVRDTEHPGRNVFRVPGRFAVDVRTSDAHANTDEFEARRPPDALEAVVAAVAASLADSQRASIQVKFVIEDDR